LLTLYDGIEGQRKPAPAYPRLGFFFLSCYM
jgi:hypothetical protein